MMLFDHISAEMTLFFILYGITGVVPLLAAIYLLLRKANAVAPNVTPPLRLRRWAASFFAASVLGHVLWYLFYIYASDIPPVGYLVIVILDYVVMMTTITGTMFAMLQDRKRPIWPVLIAMIPFSVIEVLQVLYPDDSFTYMGIAYNLSLFVLLFVYMLFAVRRYDRWLNDNYADLENKKVWLSMLVSLAFVLLFALYILVDTYFVLIYLLHIVELVFFALLLWRVETLPQLEAQPQPQQTPAVVFNIDLTNIEHLLEEHCVARQLYLQQDLSLQQLAQSIGTNRSYLSQYFSRQGITYNIYINNLRINHFISLYQEAISSRQSYTLQQLANDSGFRSYSTFSLAFKQRTGQNVTAWTREAAKA